ncbi:myb-like protein V [Episyrphus balteatus]|uniref:myb-like protein V n=1 Tax=Episyrphus balteatus TaxID=286459 RepID=UPI0024866E8C|nr:myb-like protein V [Episyrphus balteatus]
MDDIKTKSLNEKATISSAIGSPKHEDECKPSGAASTDNGNKKTDTVDDINSAQDKQDAAADLTEASTDGEDFLLRVESSDFDSETFEDAVDGEAIASKEKVDAKSATSKKSETLFSDIESSDDSIAYESQEKSDVKSVDKKTTLAPVLEKDLSEEKKTIEPEFDPVESDEEFFEDPPLPERIGQLSQESISSKSLEGEERNSTPLIDEEVGKSEELNLDTEENTRESNPEPDESLDLLVESSVELEDTIVSESIDSSNLNNEMSTEIVTGKVLEEEGSETVGDERNSPNSPNSLLLEVEKEKSSTIESDSLEKVIATSEASILPKVAPRSLSPDKNTEKKETLANDDSETTTTSSTILEDKNISSSPLPETIETDIEMTEDLILKDDEKIEVNDSIASVEEPMQIDETILEVSDASEMETNEDDIQIEKYDEILNQDELQKSIEKEIVEEQKIIDEPSKENEKVSTSAENISDNEEEFNKSIEKEPTESSEIEVKESEENSVTTKLDEVVEEENKSEENLKEIESHCDLIEDLPMIDSEAIRSDNVLEASKKLTTDDIKEIESTEKEILEKFDEEVTESLEKSNDGEKTQIEASDEIEKLPEITTDSLDEHKTAEKITDSNKTTTEIDEEEAETSKVTQSTVPDKTSPEVTKKILETSEQVIEKEAESTEKIESSKEIEESAGKAIESVKDQKSSKEIVKIVEEPTSEKEEAPQQVVDTSEKPITPTNKVGTVSETVDLIDLSDEETPANDTEKSPKPVEEEESKKHDKPKTIEEQALPRSKETTDSKEPEKVKVTEEVISSNIETLSEDIEIPEVTTEVLVEKVVEVAASLESSKSKEENQDANKSSSNEDPEIIEIDDDDDDPPPEEKKIK